MENGFNKKNLEQFLEVISNNYCTFLLYYNLYHEFLLQSSLGDHQTNEDAEKNIQIINKYISVFNGLNGLLSLSIIELHKLFDKSQPGNSEPTINLHFLINYLEQHSKNIEGSMITSEFIEACRKKITTVSNKLTHLGRSRNSRTHNLSVQKNIHLKFTDIEDISKVIDELFNYIDSVIRYNSWSFDYFHEEPKRDIKLLIEDLGKLNEIGFTIINGSGIKNDSEILKEIKKILHFEYL